MSYVPYDDLYLRVVAHLAERGEFELARIVLKRADDILKTSIKKKGSK